MMVCYQLKFSSISIREELEDIGWDPAAGYDISIAIHVVELIEWQY